MKILRKLKIFGTSPPYQKTTNTTMPRLRINWGCLNWRVALIRYLLVPVWFFSLYKIKNYKSKKLTLFIFTACRPKVYSVDTIPWMHWEKYENGEEKIQCMSKVKRTTLKKMKGVKKHLVRQGFTHRCYVHAILYGKPRYVTYFSINSKDHKVGTFKKKKLGLSGKTHFLFLTLIGMYVFYKKHISLFLAFYDKRLIEKCKIHTTPLGFYQLKRKNYSCFKCSVVGKYVNRCNTKCY